jgi:hypothetical protein
VPVQLSRKFSDDAEQIADFGIHFVRPNFAEPQSLDVPILLLIWQFAGAFMAQNRCTDLGSAARLP